MKYIKLYQSIFIFTTIEVQKNNFIRTKATQCH